MAFEKGKKYLLQLPCSWWEKGWHDKIVTYAMEITDINDVHPDELSYNDPGPFTCGVICPGLTSAYINDMFLAKPEWLSEIPAKETYVSPFSGRIM